MFYGTQPSDTRHYFFSSWKKYHEKQPLSPLENQIVQVILDHPAYHAFFHASTLAPVTPEDNPFLHLGLHLAVREQLATDRPVGIQAIYQQLSTQYPDHHSREHQLMTCLFKCLQQGPESMYREEHYLQQCRALINYT